MMIGFCFLSVLEFFHPQHPHEEDDEVEEHLKYIVVGDMEAVGPGNLHHQDAADADDVGPFDDDQSGGDVPELVFPRPREQHHKENPVQPLFQAGAFGRDEDACPAAFIVERGNDPFFAHGGDVKVKNMVEHPATLPVKQIDRPQHQLVDGAFDRPIINGLPT